MSFLFMIFCVNHLNSNLVLRNIGVLQTTVAELVTVKEHQRMSIPSMFADSRHANKSLLQLALILSCPWFGALGRLLAP